MYDAHSTEDALQMLEEITARAKHMRLGLASYPIEDVETVCGALRAMSRRPTLVPNPLATE